MQHTIALIALLLAGAVQAQQMYRCQNASGAFEYADRACDKAARAEVITIRPNSLDTSQERAVNRRLDRVHSREIANAPMPTSAGSPYNATACRLARANMATAQSANVRGKASIDDAARAVNRDCGYQQVPPRRSRDDDEDVQPPVTSAVGAPASREPIFQRGGTGIYRPDGSPGGYWGPNNDYCTSTAGGLQCDKAGFVRTN